MQEVSERLYRSYSRLENWFSLEADNIVLDYPAEEEVHPVQEKIRSRVSRLTKRQFENTATYSIVVKELSANAL